METKYTVITIYSHREEGYIESTNTTDITYFKHQHLSVFMYMHRADMITLMSDGI